MTESDPRNIYTRAEWSEEIAKAAAKHAPPLQPGGPSDRFPGMEERVAKLETHFEYVRRDLDEIKADQKAVLNKLDDLGRDIVASKHAAAGKVTVITTGIAVVAIIIGVLAFGGDRFSQGMEVASAAKAARADAEPWNKAPVVDLPLPGDQR